MENNYCVRTRGLTKKYSKFTLGALDLDIPEGFSTALIGANGAGKTTLMRMICGVLKPTSGSIRLNGKTMQELGEQYYAHLGYMPQDFGFYPDFTAREFMLYMAAVKGLTPKEARRKTDKLLDMSTCMMWRIRKSSPIPAA